MSDALIGSGDPGSPNLANGPVNTAGEPQNGNTDYQAMYTELEKKLGEQGRELGEFRTFFENIAPLLDKLDKSPELVQAIVDGKVDQELAKAVLEGKISTGQAQVVTEAHTQVKQELGKKYEKASPEEIAKLVDDKVAEVKSEMESKMTEQEELRKFEDETETFIRNTPDFLQYAPAIDAWLDEHDVTDVSVAYFAVKGMAQSEADQKAAEEGAVEAAKNVALNAAGGSSKATTISDPNVIDSLIGGRSNPNL